MKTQKEKRRFLAACDARHYNLTGNHLDASNGGYLLGVLDTLHADEDADIQEHLEYFKSLVDAYEQVTEDRKEAWLEKEFGYVAEQYAEEMENLKEAVKKEATSFVNEQTPQPINITLTMPAGYGKTIKKVTRDSSGKVVSIIEEQLNDEQNIS